MYPRRDVIEIGRMSKIGHFISPLRKASIALRLFPSNTQLLEDMHLFSTGSYLNRSVIVESISKKYIYAREKSTTAINSIFATRTFVLQLS
jgi:hypothetical protein